MSIAYNNEVLQQALTPGGGGGATTQALTVANAPGAGNLVVAAISPTNFTISSIADTRGNTWTKANARTNTTDAEMWFTVQNVAALQAADSITLTFGGTVFNVVALVESFTSGGGWPGSPLDVTATANATLTARDGGTTAGTAQAEELVVGVFSIGGGIAESSFTAGAGYSTPTTAFKVIGTATAIEMCFKVTSGTGTQQATGTGGASGGSSGITACFKNTAGSASNAKNLLLLGVG